QFRNSGTCPIIVIHSPIVIDLQIAIDRPPQLFEFLLEDDRSKLPFWIALVVHHQHADSAHRLPLLGTRNKGPPPSAKSHDEIAPPHIAPLEPQDRAKRELVYTTLMWFGLESRSEKSVWLLQVHGLKGSD